MNDNVFTPLLTTTDWNDEWKRLQVARQHSDDAAAWDKRSASFPVKHGSQEGYVNRFLQLADIQPGETVLDMGCGTGALATPLAQRGHEVIACDFSRGMLDRMLQDQAELGITGLISKQMSWADDWNEFGLGGTCVDVALASRSIATENLEEALLKLDHVARRRVCLTLPCGPTPKIDEELLRAIGLHNRMGRDFLYAFNILASNGIYPEVAYIPSTRVERFETRDEALACYCEIAAKAAEGFATAKQIGEIPAKLSKWLDENLVGDESGFHLRKVRRVTWAFIAWNTR